MNLRDERIAAEIRRIGDAFMAAAETSDEPVAVLSAAFNIFVGAIEGSLDQPEARAPLEVVLEELAKKAMAWRVRLDA